MENIDNVEVITTVTYIFFVYLVLAILVERTLEVLVAVFNYGELKFKWYEFWNRRAKVYQARFDRLYGYQGEKSARTKALFDRLLWKTITERPYEGGKEIISADIIRLNYLRVGTRVAAFLLAVILVQAFSTWRHFDLLEIIRQAIVSVIPTKYQPVIDRIITSLTKSDLIRLVLTAAAISVGTDPLHQLIRQIEKIAERKAAPAAGGEK